MRMRNNEKVYDKSELGFALAWIGIYCVGMSIFDEISAVSVWRVLLLRCLPWLSACSCFSG